MCRVSCLRWTWSALNFQLPALSCPWPEAKVRLKISTLCPRLVSARNNREPMRHPILEWEIEGEGRLKPGVRPQPNQRSRFTVRSVSSQPSEKAARYCELRTDTAN